MSAPPASGPQAALITFSVRFRWVVLTLAAVLLMYGLYALGHAKQDVFPEFAPAQVSVQTEAPGLSPEQVEQLVTTPIENAINGVSGVETLRSTSIQGLSVVKVVFAPRSDIYRDRQLVAERLAAAAQQLPQGVAPPAISPLTSSTSYVLVVGLTSARRSLLDLHTAAEWTVRRRLLAVPGVADVTVFGGDDRSLQIQVHPEKLVQYGLSLTDVLSAARQATGVRGAGFIDTDNQRLLLQAEGQSITPADLARTVVASQGVGRVTLGDVADVLDGPEPAIGAASVGGAPAVVMIVSEQYRANTVDVTKGVEAALAELRPALKAQGIDLHADLFRPASFIARAMDNVRSSLLVGAVLVIIVLSLFLFNWRTAAISVTAIPLSLVAATLALGVLGVSINTMTLGGLAIAIGEVVDDAVIGVENIVRRLRENRRIEAPRPEAQVILEAVFEVRSAVVYATLAVILVFLPVLGLPGVAGRLFSPLALAYVFAVLASLAVALTVTPALAMLLLRGDREGLSDPPLVRWSRDRYFRLLRPTLSRPRAAGAAALALAVVAAAALPFCRSEFLPELKEGHYVIHVSAAPGTSLKQSMRLGSRLSAELLAMPEVRRVAQRAGRATRADDTWGTHYSEIDVDLRPLSGEETERVEAKVRRLLGGTVGLNASVETFLSERIKETLSGYTATVAVDVVGNDLDVLDGKAAEIAQVLSRIPGARDIQVQSPPGLPQITIRLRKADLARWGLDAVEVLDLVRASYEGEVVGQTYEGAQVFNVRVLIDAKDRSDVAKVAALPVKTPGGAYVPLSQVADVFLSSGRYQVQHEGGRRVGTVTANVQGGDVAAFVRRAKAEVAQKVRLPPGVYVSFGGAAEAQAQSQRDLVRNSLVAGVAIVLLLSIVTRNWRNLLLVLANLPFAMAGGVIAVLVAGATLSLGSLVGFVTLFGITLRNSIMMISHFEHLVAEEGRTWGAETAMEGAADRLVPILMTSLVTALGLLPLAIGMDEPGREIEGPMALVILGGLMTSMALNILVLPTLALAFGRFEPAVDVLGASDAPAEPAE